MNNLVKEHQEFKQMSVSDLNDYLVRLSFNELVEKFIILQNLYEYAEKFGVIQLSRKDKING